MGPTETVTASRRLHFPSLASTTCVVSTVRTVASALGGQTTATLVTAAAITPRIRSGQGIGRPYFARVAQGNKPGVPSTPGPFGPPSCVDREMRPAIALVGDRDPSYP